MKIEIESAANFILNLARTQTNVVSDQMESFRNALLKALAVHYQEHWFPDKPCKGSAYRCIRINHKMDPVIAKAGQTCGLDESSLKSFLPNELTLWIDPKEVSYRIGENGSICVLYDEKSDAKDEEQPISPTTKSQTSINVNNNHHHLQQHVHHHHAHQQLSIGDMSTPSNGSIVSSRSSPSPTNYNQTSSPAIPLRSTINDNNQNNNNNNQTSSPHVPLRSAINNNTVLSPHQLTNANIEHFLHCNNVMNVAAAVANQVNSVLVNSPHRLNHHHSTATKVQNLNQLNGGTVNGVSDELVQQQQQNSPLSWSPPPRLDAYDAFTVQQYQHLQQLHHSQHHLQQLHQHQQSQSIDRRQYLQQNTATASAVTNAIHAHQQQQQQIHVKSSSPHHQGYLTWDNYLLDRSVTGRHHLNTNLEQLAAFS